MTIEGEGGAAAGGEAQGAHDGGAAGSGAAAGGVGGGEGGALSILAGGGEGSAAAPAGAAPGGAADPAWYAGLSADAPDEKTPSDKAWLENKKYSDLPTLVKAHRELERSYMSGDKVVIPKEGDPPERFDAFAKAIGRPDTADAYEIKLPEGATLDEGFAKTVREAAYKAGVPAAAFAGLAQAFVQNQQDQEVALIASRDQQAQAKLAEWGPQKAVHIENATRAKDKLGLTNEDIAGIQRGWGADKTLDLLAKLGGQMGEDLLIGGGGQKFGISGEAAQTQLDQLNKDPAFRKGLADKDATTIAKYDRLIGAIAADRDRKRAQEMMG